MKSSSKPSEIEASLDLVKQLLKGALYRTYKTINFDVTYVDNGEPTVEEGDNLETGFEKQWEFIKPQLLDLLADQQRLARIDELNMVPNREGADIIPIIKGWKEARLAVLKGSDDKD